MKMKKLASLFLVLMMVVGMSSAFAAMEGEITGGSITINDAVSGQTYSAYQILYLESYDAATGTYAYKANSAWLEWLKDQTEYVTVSDDGQNYVTWVKRATDELDAAAAAEFAKLAQTQLANKTADKTATADSATVVLEGLNLGYYLVDTTLGTLCSLDTTNPTVVMQEKNEAPTVTKEVEEDSTGEYGATNDADINQTVNFKATVTVQAGAENYTLHDTMSAGLTYTGVTAVKIGETVVDAANYTVTSTGLTDACTFEVKFDNDYISTLDAGTEITVEYSAVVNANAVVGLPGNTNEIKLEYGDENHPSTTPPSTTTTYTWDMDVLKYANGNEATVLAGVKFALLNSDKTQAATVENGKLTGWVAVPNSYTTAAIGDWNEKSVLTTDAQGKIAIDGLDADTYYLHELETLPGYNLLASDVTVVVEAAKMSEGDNPQLTYTTVVAKVENKSGTELPSTGGMGTTLFYIAGTILVVGALVLMITKRRVTEK